MELLLVLLKVLHELLEGEVAGSGGVRPLQEHVDLLLATNRNHDIIGQVKIESATNLI